VRRTAPHLATVTRWEDLPPALVAGAAVAVIDVLRWSTVVVTALAHGATRVEAFAEPEDALDRAQALGRAGVVLGGERGNLALPGFDVGNSPLEYSRERVGGRAVLSTTTNGTRALLAASSARAVYVGAFVNLDALTRALRTELEAGTPVMLLAAGQAGAETLEDTACAGALGERLREFAPTDEVTQRAIALWRDQANSVARVIGASPHAASLRASGLEGDLALAAQLSAFDLAPCAEGNVIRRGT
jgi:2-phosphosulfolactate phosphatase